MHYPARKAERPQEQPRVKKDDADITAHDARTIATIKSLFSVTYERGGDGSWHER